MEMVVVKLRREIASVPLRSAEETWDCITEMITGPDSIDSRQLTTAKSVMAMLLAEEHYADKPLTLKGVGHRLVIYCAYGPDAMVLGQDWDALNWNPTAGDWRLYVPCATEDLDWAQAALAKKATRIILYSLDQTPTELVEETATHASSEIEIDWSKATS
jgi:hypothetical protein